MHTPETGYRKIAYISRAKGLKGEVVLQMVDDLPFAAYKDAELWVVPPSLEGVRTTRLLEFSEQAKDCVARLEGADTVELARELAGRYLLAACGRGGLDGGGGADVLSNGDGADVPCLKPLDTCPVPAVQPENAPSLVGLPVLDALTGDEIGRIAEIRAGSAQTLWVVDATEGGEVLIPAVDAFIVELNTSSVKVTLPVGLLELNR